jgi:hypothetical protein
MQSFDTNPEALENPQPIALAKARPAGNEERVKTERDVEYIANLSLILNGHESTKHYQRITADRIDHLIDMNAE